MFKLVFIYFCRDNQIFKMKSIYLNVVSFVLYRYKSDFFVKYNAYWLYLFVIYFAN